MTYVWKQTILVLLVGFSIVMLAGHASAQSPANVTGTWTGSTEGAARTLTVVLTQTGSQVTGTLSGAGTADGPINGIVDGNSLRLKRPNGYSPEADLIVKGNQMRGWIVDNPVTLNRK